MIRDFRHYIAAGIGLALFGAAIYIIHEKLSQYHFRDIVRQFEQLPRTHLVAAMVLTILDYFVLTFYDVMALRYIRHPVKYSRTAIASFLGYAFSHNMTFLGGSAVKYRIYSMLGVSAGKVAALVAFCIVTFWLGFLTTGSIVFLFSSQQVPAALHLPFVSVRPLGAIFLIIVTAYVTLALAKKTLLRIRTWEFKMPKPRLVGFQLIISSIDWFLASSVLFVLLPASGGLDFFKFVPFFLLAQVIGLLSYVPGGLGVFETAMILLLSPFYESSAIISSLVVYRLTYYLIPFAVASAIFGTIGLMPKRAR